MARHTRILAAVVSLLVASHAVAQGLTTPPERSRTELAKFVSIKGANSRSPTITVTLLSNNKTLPNLPLDIPSRDIDDLTDLKSGDYVTVTMTSRDNKIIVTEATPYEVKPGEEEKDVYLFDYMDEKKVNNKSAAVLRVTKMGKDYEFVVPSTMQNKRPEPKENFQAIISDLTVGDSIVITATQGKPPTVRDIRRYEPPEVGKFVKQVEVGEGKDKLGAIVIADANAAERTFTFRPANKAAFQNKAKAQLKEGTVVQYRTTADDKGVWIDDFKPAPKGAELTFHKKQEARSADRDTKDPKDDKDSKDAKNTKDAKNSKDAKDDNTGGRTFGVDDDEDADVKPAAKTNTK